MSGKADAHPPKPGGDGKAGPPASARKRAASPASPVASPRLEFNGHAAGLSLPPPSPLSRPVRAPTPGKKAPGGPPVMPELSLDGDGAGEPKKKPVPESAEEAGNKPAAKPAAAAPEKAADGGGAKKAGPGRPSKAGGPESSEAVPPKSSEKTGGGEGEAPPVPKKRGPGRPRKNKGGPPRKPGPAAARKVAAGPGTAPAKKKAAATPPRRPTTGRRRSPSLKAKEMKETEAEAEAAETGDPVPKKRGRKKKVDDDDDDGAAPFMEPGERPTKRRRIAKVPRRRMGNIKRTTGSKGAGGGVKARPGAKAIATKRVEDSGDESDSSSSSSGDERFALFAFDDDPRSSVTSTLAPPDPLAARPKRKLKAVGRYDPAAAGAPSVLIGHGFNCPMCRAECTYDTKRCGSCGAEVSYVAGVGVTVLKDRDQVVMGGGRRGGRDKGTSGRAKSAGAKARSAKSPSAKAKSAKAVYAKPASAKAKSTEALSATAASAKAGGTKAKSAEAPSAKAPDAKAGGGWATIAKELGAEAPSANDQSAEATGAKAAGAKPAKAVSIEEPSRRRGGRGKSAPAKSRAKSPPKKSPSRQKSRRSATFTSVESDDSDGEEFSLFAFDGGADGGGRPGKNKPAPDGYAPGRPRRALKSVTRYDASAPASATNARCGEGFDCPVCSSVCTYDARACGSCGARVSYEAGVGVTLLRDRDEVVPAALARVPRAPRGRGAGAGERSPKKPTRSPAKPRGTPSRGSPGSGSGRAPRSTEGFAHLNEERPFRITHYASMQRAEGGTGANNVTIRNRSRLNAATGVRQRPKKQKGRWRDHDFRHASDLATARRWSYELDAAGRPAFEKARTLGEAMEDPRWGEELARSHRRLMAGTRVVEFLRGCRGKVAEARRRAGKSPARSPAAKPGRKGPGRKRKRKSSAGGTEEGGDERLSVTVRSAAGVSKVRLDARYRGDWGSRARYLACVAPPDGQAARSAALEAGRAAEGRGEGPDGVLAAMFGAVRDAAGLPPEKAPARRRGKKSVVSPRRRSGGRSPSRPDGVPKRAGGAGPVVRPGPGRARKGAPPPSKPPPPKKSDAGRRLGIRKMPRKMPKKMPPSTVQTGRGGYYRQRRDGLVPGSAEAMEADRQRRNAYMREYATQRRRGRGAAEEEEREEDEEEDEPLLPEGCSGIVGGAMDAIEGFLSGLAKELVRQAGGGEEEAAAPPPGEEGAAAPAGEEEAAAPAGEEEAAAPPDGDGDGEAASAGEGAGPVGPAEPPAAAKEAGPGKAEEGEPARPPASPGRREKGEMAAAVADLAAAAAPFGTPRKAAGGDGGGKRAPAEPVPKIPRPADGAGKPAGSPLPEPSLKGGPSARKGDPKRDSAGPRPKGSAAPAKPKPKGSAAPAKPKPKGLAAPAKPSPDRPGPSPKKAPGRGPPPTKTAAGYHSKSSPGRKAAKAAKPTLTGPGRKRKAPAPGADGEVPPSPGRKRAGPARKRSPGKRAPEADKGKPEKEEEAASKPGPAGPKKILPPSPPPSPGPDGGGDKDAAAAPPGPDGGGNGAAAPPGPDGGKEPDGPAAVDPSLLSPSSSDPASSILALTSAMGTELDAVRSERDGLSRDLLVERTRTAMLGGERDRLRSANEGLRGQVAGLMEDLELCKRMLEDGRVDEGV